MKDMFIHLDIIWLNRDKEVVYIMRDLPPCTPVGCPSYGPQENALYVIEVNANYTLRHNITNGTQVFF
jgi:hypothetical protein